MCLQFIRKSSVIIGIFIVVITSKGCVYGWPRLGEHHDDGHRHQDDDHHHGDHHDHDHHQQQQQRSKVVCMDGPRLGGQRDGWEGSVKTYACAMPVTIVIFIIVIVVNGSEYCSSLFTIIVINHDRKSIKWTITNTKQLDHPPL